MNRIRFPAALFAASPLCITPAAAQVESGRAEALSYFPAAINNPGEPRHYLEIIRCAREAVAIAVIASLNGISPSGWRDYARMVEQAGASAIELNAYFIPSDLRLSRSQVEDAYLDTLKAVKAAIPVALKLSPYFSALGHVIRALDAAGARRPVCSWKVGAGSGGSFCCGAN